MLTLILPTFFLTFPPNAKRNKSYFHKIYPHPAYCNKITSTYFQLYILPSATIVMVKFRNQKYDVLINFLGTKLLNIRPKITTLIANSIYHLKTVKTLQNLNETL